MENTPVSNSMRISRRDGAWLVAAVLLHGSLALIPLSTHLPMAPESDVLSVSLLMPPAPEILTTETVEENQTVEETLPEPENTPEPENYPEPRVAEQSIEQAEPQPLEEIPPPQPTAAALVASTREFKWKVPESITTRRLGEAPAREVPENWLSGIKMEDNLFDGMMVPASIEVVDQWVAVDGSRNVVLNTPSGQTLCGRAQAWDPMNPMVEQLMMFRTCGGGGKRTFKMPDRFLKNK